MRKLLLGISAAIVCIASILSIISLNKNTANSEASYFIFQNAKTIYARNTQTGATEFQGKDAGAVINSVINGTSANSVEIEIGKGSYPIESIIRPKSGVQIIGQGMRNTILQATNYQSMILNAHPNAPSLGIEDHDLVIGNFTIDFRSFTGDVINLVSVKHARVFNIIIANVTSDSDALDFDGSDDVLVNNTQFYNIGGSAVHISASFAGWPEDWASHKGSSNIKVINSYAYNVGKTRHIAAYNTFAPDHGLGAAFNDSFSNIKVENSYSGIGFSNLTIGCSVDNALINNTVSEGVLIHSGAKDNLVSNVAIYNAGEYGILIYKASNATIENVKVLSSGFNAVAISNSRNIKIIDSKFDNEKKYEHPDILISNSTQVIVKHNTILSSKNIGAYTIEEKGDSDYNIIIGNELTRPAKIIGKHTSFSPQP